MRLRRILVLVGYWEGTRVLMRGMMIVVSIDGCRVVVVDEARVTVTVLVVSV
jgi:hypothetical protein